MKELIKYTILLLLLLSITAHSQRLVSRCMDSPSIELFESVDKHNFFALPIQPEDRIGAQEITVSLPDRVSISEAGDGTNGTILRCHCTGTEIAHTNASLVLSDITEMPTTGFYPVRKWERMQCHAFESNSSNITFVCDPPTLNKTARTLWWGIHPYLDISNSDPKFSTTWCIRNAYPMFNHSYNAADFSIDSLKWPDLMQVRNSSLHDSPGSQTALAPVQATEQQHSIMRRSGTLYALLFTLIAMAFLAAFLFLQKKSKDEGKPMLHIIGEFLPFSAKLKLKNAAYRLTSTWARLTGRRGPYAVHSDGSETLNITVSDSESYSGEPALSPSSTRQTSSGIRKAFPQYDRETIQRYGSGSTK